MADEIWRRASDGKIIRRASDGKIVRCDVCPCECCERLRNCVDGRDIEIVVSGVANGTCTSCSVINNTFLASAVTVNDPGTLSASCDVREEPATVDPCGASGSDWILNLDIVVTSLSAGNMNVVFTDSAGASLTYGKTFADCQAMMDELCSELPISLTFNSGLSSTHCNGSSSTCTVQVLP